MPNPELMDFQIRQVAAYLLSLRTQDLRAPGSAGATTCGTEIARVESALSQAREQPEGGAAATPQPRRRTKGRANAGMAATAEKKLEAALTRARKLDSEGKDAACIAALSKLALPHGAN